MLGGVASMFDQVQSNPNKAPGTNEYGGFAVDGGILYPGSTVTVGGKPRTSYWYVPEGNQNYEGGLILAEDDNGTLQPLYARGRTDYSSLGIPGMSGPTEDPNADYARLGPNPVRSIDWSYGGLETNGLPYDPYEWSFGLPSTEGWEYRGPASDFSGNVSDGGWYDAEGNTGNPLQGYGLAHGRTYGSTPKPSTFEDIMGDIGPLIGMMLPYTGLLAPIGSAVGGGITGAAAMGATSGAGMAALQGAKLEDILKAGALGGGLAAAPGALGMLGDSLGLTAGGLDVPTSAGQLAAEGTGDLPGMPAYDGGPSGALLAGDVPDMSSLFSPNSYVNQPEFMQAGSLDEALTGSTSPVYGDLAEGVTYVPGTFSGYDATGAATFDGTPTEAPSTLSDADKAGLKKFANEAYKMLGEAIGSDTIEGAPTQDEGETDEQYAQELATYLDLDAGAMAEQGLVPGTPEYMEYILAEADKVIKQVLGEGWDDATLADEDVDADELSAALREKTAEEQQQLKKALYVRGQLDLMMGSGTYEDPFTGEMEDVISPDGTLVNPSEAAYQRGRAGDVETLAGLRGEDALSYLDELLGRDTDLFGMQQSADARFEQAKLEDDIRRRRGGMFG
jgi:hypothetical protein